MLSLLSVCTEHWTWLVFSNIYPQRLPGTLGWSKSPPVQSVRVSTVTKQHLLIHWYFTDIHGMIVDSWRGAHGHRHIERTIFVQDMRWRTSAYKFAGLQFFHPPLVLSLNSLTTVTPKNSARELNRSLWRPSAFPRPGTLIQRCLRRAPGKWLL